MNAGSLGGTSPHIGRMWRAFIKGALMVGKPGHGHTPAGGRDGINLVFHHVSTEGRRGRRRWNGGHGHRGSHRVRGRGMRRRGRWRGHHHHRSRWPHGSDGGQGADHGRRVLSDVSVESVCKTPLHGRGAPLVGSLGSPSIGCTGTALASAWCPRSSSIR